jgi:hypothetical protein
MSLLVVVYMGFSCPASSVRARAWVSNLLVVFAAWGAT